MQALTKVRGSHRVTSQNPDAHVQGEDGLVLEPLGHVAVEDPLGQAYITDRFLPDKAIDLMDEAASKIRMEIDSLPGELDEINRKIMRVVFGLQLRQLPIDVAQPVPGALVLLLAQGLLLDLQLHDLPVDGTSSSPSWPGGSSTASAPPPWTSTASISRRTAGPGPPPRRSCPRRARR